MSPGHIDNAFTSWLRPENALYAYCCIRIETHYSKVIRQDEKIIYVSIYIDYYRNTNENMMMGSVEPPTKFAAGRWARGTAGLKWSLVCIIASIYLYIPPAYHKLKILKIDCSFWWLMIGGDTAMIYWLLTDVTHLHLIRWRLLGGPFRLQDVALHKPPDGLIWFANVIKLIRGKNEQ